MKSTDLSAFDNSWYNQGSIVMRLLWYTFHLIFFNSGFPFSAFKVTLLKMFGAKTGKGIVIKPYVRIKYPWNLQIGNHVWIGEEVWIDNLGIVTIGDNCCLSQGAMLLCGNHDFTKSTFNLLVGNITLENGTWIGAKSVVCPGVKCGSHSVLTVGSIATKDLDPYSIYQGNPAVKVKDRIIKE